VSFPEDAPLKSASATLTDPSSREVVVWFSSPELPANAKFAKQQNNTICLIPCEPLRPNTTYQVVVRGRRQGKAWEKAWQFTTGGTGPPAAEAARQALERINRYRAEAGLNPVTLDPGMSKACLAHAEYLVRNAAVLGQKKLPANDEDPKLPGFTAAGQVAARQSEVFSRAPDPVTQIDDLMGTFLRRVYLLDPQLQRVGVGHADDVGRGWHCVLNLYGGRDSERVVLFPVPDQEAVPCRGADHLPGKAVVPGYPISVVFPAHYKIFAARGTLTDTDGNLVETLLTTPEHPLESPALQRNSVGLHPREPLRAGHTYSVTFSVVVNGKEWRKSWQFTTEP
jgi:hypothetical protein